MPLACSRHAALLAFALIVAACSSSPDPTCIPHCDGRVCGEDGCGGSCGTCSTGQRCDGAYQCVPENGTCQPACAGRACGDDGCGGSCGTCPLGTACGAGGACASVSCSASQVCFAPPYTAIEYDCTRPSAAAPWQCAPLFEQGRFTTPILCGMSCTGGESACHEGDTDVRAECLACIASCATASDALCPWETPGVCPEETCSCR